MELKSSAFKNNEIISKLYTCDGKDISPPLNWNDIPEKTKSLALICDDPDAPAGTWVHWVVYNIKSNENGKFLGVFKMKLKVEAEVDPETGEIIYKNKPWWAFLVDEGDDDGGNVDTGLNGSNNNTNNSV